MEEKHKFAFTEEGDMEWEKALKEVNENPQGYSENEKKLFRAIWYDDLNTIEVMLKHTSPMELYNSASLKAFRQNMKTEAVEALRRAMNHFEQPNGYRRNDEFEKLIEFEPLLKL